MFRSQVLVIVVLLAILAAACAPITATPSPILTEDPTMVSVATVRSIDILLLESFPLQVNAVIRGDLPDAGCTKIASIDQVREGNTFRLTLVTTTDPLALCAQALTPFEQVVSLDVLDLPAGTYTVEAGGVQQTFTFDVDNSLEQPADPDVSPTDVKFVLAQQDVSIYGGPGTQFSVIGNIAAGQTAKVTGVSSENNWWRVMCPDDTVGDCWVSADPALTQPAEAPG
jgi:inhibitor of cysteine peptidase